MSETGRPLTTALRRTAWELRTIAGRWPLLCRSLLRRSGEVTTSETEICIEGFPRCGNTFAVVAFQAAQPRTISIAHHVHAPGSVLIATRLGKPALVLIREPEAAVLSLLVRIPFLTASQALRSYRRFYRPLMSRRSDLVVGRFDEVVSDLGGVIRRVNDRFGAGFREFDPVGENLRAVSDEVDQWDRGAFVSGEGRERGGASPSALRNRMKEDLRPVYLHPRLARRRAAAERLYRRFVEETGRS